MTPESRGRTLAALLALIAIIVVNTGYTVAIDGYRAWVAWSVVALAVVCLSAALRLQARLALWQMLALLALPLLIATLGALLSRAP